MHRTGGIERFLNAFVVNCAEKLEWDISRHHLHAEVFSIQMAL